MPSQAEAIPAEEQAAYDLQELLDADTDPSPALEVLVENGPGAGPYDPDEAQDRLVAMYFRDLSTLTVLTAEQELQAARRIESLELALWAHLLASPRLLERLSPLISRHLQHDSIELARLRALGRSLRRSLGASRQKQRQQHGALCEQVARLLHREDQDRQLLAAAMKELQGAAREKSRLPSGAGASAVAEHQRQALSLAAALQRARHDFVKANLRLVVTIALRYNHGKMPLGDLIQEGNLGLIKAVERFDYHRGFRFSTYASWWIRHAITRAVADKARLVRLPVHVLGASHKVARTASELTTQLGRQPTTDEIGSAAGLRPEKVVKLQANHPGQTLSLNRSLSDDDSRQFLGMLQDPEALFRLEKLDNESVSVQLRQILSCLRPMELDVLSRRFGLDNSRVETLKEIGKSYRLSRERIRQIQEQALIKLRRSLEARRAI